jgi:tryptophan 2,3-dioxygenase
VTSPGRRFGEEGGLLTYGGYLHVDELLAQQVPQVDPPVHDELLFITVHQAYELRFKQLLHDLGAARDAMMTEEPWRARQLLRRAHVIERLLISQVDVLETMTPQDFLEFRAALAPASGFQSVQFRELEFLSGAKDAAFVARFRSLTDAECGRLARRLAEPSLWDAYLDLLRSRGLAVAGDEQVLATLVSIAKDRAGQDELRQLAEDLLSHDELAALWRARHVRMVSGRSARSLALAAQRAHHTCTSGYRCATTRCCGSCGIGSSGSAHYCLARPAGQAAGSRSRSRSRTRSGRQCPSKRMTPGMACSRRRPGPPRPRLALAMSSVTCAPTTGMLGSRS